MARHPDLHHRWESGVASGDVEEARMIWTVRFSDLRDRTLGAGICVHQFVDELIEGIEMWLESLE